MIGGQRIDSLWAFVAVDEDGDEGVAAFMLDGVWTPLIGADLARVNGMRPYAQAIATRTGQRLRLLHFSRRTDGEVVEP